MNTINRENLSPETAYNMVFDDVFNPNIEVFSARAQGSTSRIMLYVHKDKDPSAQRGISFRLYAVIIQQIVERPTLAQFAVKRVNVYDRVLKSREELLAYCQECFKRFKASQKQTLPQSGAAAARRFDKPKVAGASPASATKTHIMERTR